MFVNIASTVQYIAVSPALNKLYCHNVYLRVAFNPLIMNGTFGCHPTLSELPGEIIIKFYDSFYWRTPKNRAEGVGGGPSVVDLVPAVAAPDKTADTGSSALPDACFMQIPASESLFFPFSLTEGANSGRI